MPERAPAEVMASLQRRFGNCPPPDLNEASTRLQIINEVLEHVLGWSRQDFNPEEYVEGTSSEGGQQRGEWLDYHLRSAQSLKLVVEAKRTGITFQLPTDRKQRVILTFPRSSGQRNYAAIDCLLASSKAMGLT